MPSTDSYMERHFLPVGQGAFYYERFHDSHVAEPFTMVYDCGVLDMMEPGREKLQEPFLKALQLHFTQWKTINALYISHLDEDHVNGLELLEQHGVNIEHFFMPAIDSKNRRLMEMWLESTAPNGLAIGLIQNASVVMGQMFPGVKVHFVPETNTRGTFDPTPRTGSGPNSTSSQSTLSLRSSGWISSDEHSPFEDWEFVPFNYCQQDYIDALQKALAKVLGLSDSVSNEELYEEWAKNGKSSEIKKAYRQALPRWGGQKSFHTNSMCLFSGPRERRLHQKLYPCGPESVNWYVNLTNLAPGGLYTGDYDAKDLAKKPRNRPKRMAALKDAYKGYWDNIGCVQIPHHGSKHNFDDEFTKMDAIFVASAASKNRYRHPNVGVRNAFDKCGRHLFCVNEKEETCLCAIVRPEKTSPLEISCPEQEKIFKTMLCSKDDVELSESQQEA